MNTLYEASVHAFKDLFDNQMKLGEMGESVPKSRRETTMENMIKSNFGQAEIIEYRNAADSELKLLARKKGKAF